MQHILGLHAVSANVLHGTRTHLSRNGGQVFQSMIAMGYGIGNHFVKDLSTATTKIYMLPIRVKRRLNALNGGVEHGALVILGEQKITASTDNQQRFILRGKGMNHPHDLLHGIKLQKPSASGVYSKGVVLQKTIVTQVSHVRYSTW